MTTRLATFGAGCFWGSEKFFRKHFPELLRCEVGYLGGQLENPSYEQVCSGNTGHAEVVQCEYDPNKTKYSDLVHLFFRFHDPTTKNRQGNDKGTQYRSAIFYHDSEQQKLAEAIKEEIQKEHYPNTPIVTEVTAASKFWKAEEYHQNYLHTHPGGYCNHSLRW